MKMNAEIKARWVNALRSGSYQQGKGVLSDGNLFCCLGVLCDLHSKETMTPWSPLEDEGVAYKGAIWTLPPDVIAWAGLGERDPFVKGFCLSQWNDDGVSFHKIAGLIEEHL